MAQSAQDERQIVAQNKKARHDYFVLEAYEAGIELFGTEVKSLRAGTVNLKDSFSKVEDGEMFAYGVHISPYEKGNIFNREPLRRRRLLLHKSEILRLQGQVQTKGYTIMPLQVYFKKGLVKIEIGLARGKKLYDKRDDLRKKAIRRETEREYREQLKL